jgi:hypothetical protein
MDLNPKEAVVDQEPLNAPEQEEGPFYAFTVPKDIVREALHVLNLLAADRGWRKLQELASWGTKCYTTRSGGDLTCNDRT